MSAVDTVSVKVPLKAEFVSIVRLTASGIASRLGFDIDTIEDIKVALSEVLNKIIKNAPEGDSVAIDFSFSDDGILIRFVLDQGVPDRLFDRETDEFAWAIISTLMDRMEIHEKGPVWITMEKRLGKAVGDEQ